MQGNRKFWVTLTALLGALLLGLLGKLTAEYATVATLCVGAFTWGNSQEHKFQNATPTVVNNSA